MATAALILIIGFVFLISLLASNYYTSEGSSEAIRGGFWSNPFNLFKTSTTASVRPRIVQTTTSPPYIPITPPPGSIPTSCTCRTGNICLSGETSYGSQSGCGAGQIFCCRYSSSCCYCASPGGGSTCKTKSSCTGPGSGCAGDCTCPSTNTVSQSSNCCCGSPGGGQTCKSRSSCTGIGSGCISDCPCPVVTTTPSSNSCCMCSGPGGGQTCMKRSSCTGPGAACSAGSCPCPQSVNCCCTGPGGGRSCTPRSSCIGPGVACAGDCPCSTTTAPTQSPTTSPSSKYKYYCCKHSSGSVFCTGFTASNTCENSGYTYVSGPYSTQLQCSCNSGTTTAPSSTTDSRKIWCCRYATNSVSCFNLINCQQFGITYVSGPYSDVTACNAKCR